MSRDPEEYLKHGDYVPHGRQGIKLVVPKADYEGHEIVSNGWGNCPRCNTMTTLFGCSTPRCKGIRTSNAHERDCPR